MADDAVSITSRDAAGFLRAMATGLRAEIAAFPSALPGWHPAPGEWCVKEVLGHLIEAERRGFAGRIRVILASDGPGLETWDQAAVAHDRRDCERDLERLLDEFMQLRDESATLVDSLTESDLSRGGYHPKVGYLRINDLLHEWIHHDRNHTRQILANVQAFVWPGMGNAQRFSAP
jgi:hypothetical protein